MTAALEVRGLRKAFGRLVALRGVDLTVETGRVTAIVGPNAAGKSTLIKCLLGLVRPDAGRITVLGQPAGGDPGYRHAIGYMPQLPRFPDNLTGREVLAFLADLRGTEEPVEELVERFHLEEALDKPVRALSGGTRQKLNAVVAFRHRPPLLVLDEPTASLDPVASGILKERVRHDAGGGATVLLTSHVMTEVEELADDLVYLVEGAVRFHGTLDALRLRTGEKRVERAVAALMREAA
ncbi:MAG: ABC transporter ATP-binding protein [Gemmatimonadales bacterium]|jgi:Cu-processing system ATP-binding protein|nr:ABC transporter ATP-binding protein [Gemmatimonadales bacterium]